MHLSEYQVRTENVSIHTCFLIMGQQVKTRDYIKLLRKNMQSTKGTQAESRNQYH